MPKFFLFKKNLQKQTDWFIFASFFVFETKKGRGANQNSTSELGFNLDQYRLRKNRFWVYCL